MLKPPARLRCERHAASASASCYWRAVCRDLPSSPSYRVLPWSLVPFTTSSPKILFVARPAKQGGTRFRRKLTPGSREPGRCNGSRAGVGQPQHSLHAPLEPSNLVSSNASGKASSASGPLAGLKSWLEWGQCQWPTFAHGKLRRETPASRTARAAMLPAASERTSLPDSQTSCQQAGSRPRRACCPGSLRRLPPGPARQKTRQPRASRLAVSRPGSPAA